MAEEKTRYVKTVRITYNDVEKDKVDTIINSTINTIKKNDGKIISFMHQVFGIGFSTVYLLYTIVYERHAEIPKEEFTKKTSNQARNKKELS